MPTTTKKRVSFSELPDDRTQGGIDYHRGYKEEEEEEEEEQEQGAENLDQEQVEEQEDVEADGGGEGWDEEQEDTGGGRLASFTDPTQLQKPAFPPRVAHCSDGSPATTAASAALSPVRKKLTALQDRRVNTILLEALQLVDCSKDELLTIEKSIKKLRDAIYGFSILVDKQVNIIGAETLEERGRIRADIQDLAENLKISYEGFASTCSRMRHTLATGKQHIQLHKKRNTVVASTTASTTTPVKAPGCSSPSSKKVVTSSGYGASSSSPTRRAPLTAAASSPSIADGGLSFSPTCGRVPLMSILDCQPSELELEIDTTAETETEQQHRNHHQHHRDTTSLYMTPEFFGSLMRSVGLDEKEFLDAKDLIRFLQEMLTFSIAKSQALTFMGKAFHRRLIPSYARDLVQLIAEELQLSTTTTVVLVPNNTFCDFMCQAPYHFDALLDRLYVSDANQYTGEPSPVASPMAPPAANPFSDHFTSNGRVLHDGKIVQTLLVNKPDAEMLETAEQTLAMAKLLHDLANAESEARRGNRISIRAQPTRNNEFSRAYLATSKELLSRETGVN